MVSTTTIAFVVFIGLIILLCFLVRHYRAKGREEDRLKIKTLEWILAKERKDFQRAKESQKRGLQRQKGSVAGQFFERFLPCLSEYPYNPSDVVAVFDIFDLLVLRGRGADNKEPILEVIFQEIKTGQNPTLTATQKSLYDCIKARRVKFEIWYRGNDEEKFHLVSPT